MRVYCLYNIRPEVPRQEWERFILDEDIPFTLAFPSITGYRVNRNGSSPGSSLAFDYLEEIDITSRDAFEADMRSARWKEGMDAWYSAGGATWFFFFPQAVSSG